MYFSSTFSKIISSYKITVCHTNLVLIKKIRTIDKIFAFSDKNDLKTNTILV